MVFLLGKIVKIGGISGKRIYFKTISEINLPNYFFSDEKETISYSEAIGAVRVEVKYGATHCLNCSEGLVEAALLAHNDNKIIFIEFNKEKIISLKEISKLEYLKQLAYTKINNDALFNIKQQEKKWK